MEFTSVFDEASRDHEAEDLLVRQAAARAETQGVWPFLALAQSEDEFGHRLALAEDRLSAIASRHGLSYEDVTAPLREGFAVLHPKAAAGETCRNCGHANPPHRKGGLCSVCGCESFQPRTHTSAIQPVEAAKGGHAYQDNSWGSTCKNCGMDKPEPGEWVPDCSTVSGGFGDPPRKKAAKDEDEGVRFGCPDCHGMGMSFSLAPGKAGGLKHCDTCADSGVVYRKRKDDSTGGYSHGDFHFTPAPRHTSGLTPFDERIATLHVALVEGQDPLGWLDDASAPATPTRHDTTEHLLGTNPVALDQAMSQGGGTGTPENPGGHSKTQKTTARGDAPFG
jgi:hypothetical protein